MDPHRTPITHARLARDLAPPRHPRHATRGRRALKLAILTWASAYALITTFLALLGPSIAGWPLALRTLVLSVTMVSTLTWVIMPRLTRLFRPWLAG